MIQDPLIEDLLSIEGVYEVNIAEVSKNRIGRIGEVTVCIQSVDNLPETYQKIEKKLSLTLGEGNYSISLCQTDDDFLSQVYHHIHFTLYEGERLGNYSQMIEGINDRLSTFDGILSYQLWVDQERIYLQLNSEHATMNKVIPLNRNEETCS